MIDWVLQQLVYSATTDACFLSQWNRMSVDDRGRLYHDLRLLDRRRRELRRKRIDPLSQHGEVHRATRTWFHEVQEVEIEPTTHHSVLIEAAQNRKFVKFVYERINAALTSLRACAPVPVIRFYGGMKDPRSVQAKVDAFRQGGTLDLDDVVRFRFVLANLTDMLVFCRVFAASFDLARCRDYYSRPRHGAEDPYRGLHFLIRGWDGFNVEVQLLTALRESIGAIDHSLVLKKQVAYLSRRHRQWLASLSLIANIVDYEIAAPADLAHDNQRSAAPLTTFLGRSQVFQLTRPPQRADKGPDRNTLAPSILTLG